MYSLSLEIPWLPTSLNESLRAGRYANNAKNKAWDQYIWHSVHGKAPPKPLKKAKLKITRHAHRMLDYDGLVGSLKPVVDALVFAQVIADDSWNVLGRWEVDQQYRPERVGQLLTIIVFAVPD
jgi:hypothetical protein